MKILSKLQPLFLLVSAFFIVVFLRSNWTNLSSLHFQYNWWLLLLSLVFSVFDLFFLATRIKALYETETDNLHWKGLFKTVAKTNLYRYIPGGLWNHAGLAFSTAELTGKSVKTTSKLQFLNIIFNIYVGTLFLFFVLPQPYNFLLVLVFLISLFLINWSISIFNKLWTKFHFKQKIQFANITSKHLFNILIHNFGFWLFNGLSFVYFLQGLGLIENLDIFKQVYLASGYILSWIAGFLFIPAPQGIGIREMVLGVFFNNLGLKIVLGVSISLLYRVLLLVRDVLIYVVSLFVRD